MKNMNRRIPVSRSFFLAALLLIGAGLAAAQGPSIDIPSPVTTVLPPDSSATLTITVTNTTPAYSLLFEIHESPGTCDALADIPWISTSPISGTMPVGGSTPIDVNFDSTGLMPGNYTGLLCFALSYVTSSVTSTASTVVGLTVQGPIPAAAGIGLVALTGLLAAVSLHFIRKLS